ncbi:MAG: PAS domain S-box protein [Deltaproteobacteria bacterium]|nr:PAS domain S-box protein [Deltaproteobacteria bacterium]
MEADTLQIVSSRSIPDLVERVHTVARKFFKVEHTALGIPSMSGGQMVLAASTDSSTKWGQILMVGHVPEFQSMLHEHRPVALVRNNDAIYDLRQLGSMYPSANLIVPALVRGRIIGIIMWMVEGGVKPEMAEAEQLRHISLSCGQAIERINNMESLRSDNARWHDEYAGLLGELDRLDLYGDLFRFNPDGQLLVNHAGRTLLANPSAESVLCPDGAPLPDNLQELIADDSLEVFSELLDGFKQGIFPRGLDLTIKRNSGEIAEIAVSISLVPRDPEVILLTLRNVTVERQIERSLEETKTFVEKVISSSLDAFIASDTKGEIVMFNETAARMWGIPLDEALSGMHVNDLYPPEQAKDIMIKLRSEDYGGVGRMEPQRIWLMARTGENIPVQLSAYLIYDEEGNESYTIGSFSDLREKLRAEEKIAFIEEKLAQSEKQMELSELAGAMAHELNQPLTSIYGSTELLL